MSKIVLGEHKDRPVEVDLGALIHGRLLLQGISGAGKSWALRRLLEQSWGKVQQIVLDIEGEYASLADVFGHLVVEAGEVRRVGAHRLAGAVRQHRISVIVDLSEAERAEQVALATDFARGLLAAPEEHWTTALVAIDEAHHLAPLGAAAGIDDEARKQAVAALTDLMARGRKRGLIGVIATQRLAKIAKSVVSEAANLIIGKNTLDLDMGRAADMMGIRRRDADRVLRALKPGWFVAVGPAISASAITVKIGDVESDHRGQTPALSKPPILGADQAMDILAAIPDAPAEPRAAGGRPGAWTDGEIGILVEGWEGGRPRAEVAAELGRTLTSCYQKASQMGIKGLAPAKQNAWTDEELRILTEGYEAGLTRQAIAARLPGRTLSALGYKAGELGLFKAARPWTDAEKAELRRLIEEEGVTPNEAAAALDRPRGGINSMMCTLRIHVRKPWREEEYELLRIRHAEGMRMIDVARELDRPYANVAKIAQKMGLSFAAATQQARQPRANRLVRVSCEQLLELVKEHHQVASTPKGWIVDGYSYRLAQLVALVNRRRTAAGEAPVTLAEVA